MQSLDEVAPGLLSFSRGACTKNLGLVGSLDDVLVDATACREWSAPGGSLERFDCKSDIPRNCRLICTDGVLYELVRKTLLS